MAADIRLIATDLDGTLIGGANELPFYADFSERMESLRGQFGAVWVACTGRKFSSFSEFFRPMRRMGLQPDYVIVRHSYIFRRTRIGFIPHIVWNISILIRVWRENRSGGEAINDWHETLTAGAIGVSTIRRSNRRLGLRFESEESARVAADLLRKKVRGFRHLQIFNRGSDVDVRTVPATKGLALSELASYLDIERQQMLAIGNGANDLSMLDGNVAGMVGCVANSDPEVMQAVNLAGGHIAGARSLRGVIEILAAFSQGHVRSELPRDWQPAHDFSNPARSKKASSTGGHGRPNAHPLMFAGIIYAGLLAFASFDILPFSSWIRKPLDLLVLLVATLVDKLF